MEVTILFTIFAYIDIIMAKKFGIPVYCENKLEVIKKVIDIHLTLNPPEDNLVKKAKEALAYYILYGFNEETVSDVETIFPEKIKKKYVTSINSFLRKGGYLIKDERNKQKSHLSPEMQKYREEYGINNGKTITIGFIHKT